MIVVLARDTVDAQRDVLLNWPNGEVIGTIAYTTEEFAEMAQQFRDDIQPDPPWMRVSPN